MLGYFKALVAGISVLLVLFLGVGFFVPSEWAAERSVTVDAPPEAIWPWLADLRQWDAWAPLGEVEATYPEGTRGVGARRVWDDAAWGSGEVTVTAVEEDRSLSYDVLVEGGLRTRGSLRLDVTERGTRVTWREEGDLGWNPLLTWFAAGMDTRQGAQLERGLRRLEQEIERPAAR
jgi:hypothetical protein